jgi:hypothetical protein
MRSSFSVLLGVVLLSVACVPTADEESCAADGDATMDCDGPEGTVISPVCVDGFWSCPDVVIDANADGCLDADALGVECVDACDRSIYGPSCVDGRWTCAGPLTCED